MLASLACQLTFCLYKKNPSEYVSFARLVFGANVRTKTDANTPQIDVNTLKRVSSATQRLSGKNSLFVILIVKISSFIVLTRPHLAHSSFNQNPFRHSYDVQKDGVPQHTKETPTFKRFASDFQFCWCFCNSTCDVSELIFEYSFFELLSLKGKKFHKTPGALYLLTILFHMQIPINLGIYCP